MTRYATTSTWNAATWKRGSQPWASSTIPGKTVYGKPTASHHTMISKHCIEEAYCFLHQKQRVYQFSTDTRQREDIEYAVEQFVDGMPPSLYAAINGGDTHYLRDYTVFAAQLEDAVDKLESLLD